MIEKERCTIRPLQKSDYIYIKALYTNEEVRKYLGGTVTEPYSRKKF